MNKNIRHVFSCLLFCLFFVEVAFAQTQVGVSVGDMFTYDCLLLGTRDESSGWELWMPERNQSRWEVMVTQVAGTRVTFQLKILLANGTEENLPSQFVDLFSGGSNGPNYMFMVSSNLNVSDRVFVGGGVDYIVNETVARDYEGEERVTNRINFASAFDYRDAYNDKTTGALVELTATHRDLAGTFSLRLIDSSVWIVPEFSPAAILCIMVLSGLCIVALLRRKNAKRLLP